MNLNNISQIKYEGREIALAKLNGDVIYEKTYVPVDPEGRKLIMTYTIANANDKHTFNNEFEYVSDAVRNDDGNYIVNLYAYDDFSSFQCNRNTLTIEYINMTNKVTDMNNMFYGCNKLTKIEGIEKWNTSNVTNMQYMFGSCSSLTSLDLSSWNVSNVTNMWNMFNYCTSLNSINLEGWDVRKANTQTMLAGCSSLTDINVKNWKCGNLLGCFINCPSLKTINLSGWDTTNTKSMQQLFYNCSSLTTIYGISSLNTSNVTNMYGLFAYTKLGNEAVDYVEEFNTHKVTNMAYLFAGLKLIAININFDTSNVNDMSYMFVDTYGSTSITNFVTISFDTDNVNDMSYMFSNSSLHLNIQTWPKGNCSHMFEYFSGHVHSMYSGSVTNARYMFAESNIDSSSLYSILTNLEFGSCYDMSYMFYNCTNLDYISFDYSDWACTTYSLNTCEYMFAGCYNLTSISLPYMYTHNVYNCENMFMDIYSYNCNIYVGENFTLQPYETGFDGEFQYY